MGRNRNVYDSSLIPQYFRYPRAYLKYLDKPFDIYPWRLIDTKSRVGTMRMERVVRDGKQLVPFAILELGDGDTACFNGADLSGDPSVEMLILDGSNRSYSFLNFNDWLQHAKEDSKKWNK